MGNNLYSNLVNFYNINDENFKEFMSEIYKEMLSTHRDVQYVKEHLTEEIEKQLEIYLNDGKFNINIEEKVNEFLENNQEIKDITAKLIVNTNNIENISSQLEEKMNLTSSNDIAVTRISRIINDGSNNALSNPQGFCFDGENYYCAYRQYNGTGDDTLTKIVKYDYHFNEITSTIANYGHGNSICYANGFIYITDLKNNVFKLNSIDLNLINSFKIPYGISAIAFNNEKFYLLGNGKVYITDDFILYTEINYTLPVNSGVSQGFDTDGKFIYMLRTSPNIILQYDMNGKLIYIHRIPLYADKVFKIGEVEDLTIINNEIVFNALIVDLHNTREITSIFKTNLKTNIAGNTYQSFIELLNQSDAFNIYVDPSNTNKNPLGTFSNPFPSLYEALCLCSNGFTKNNVIYIKKGVKEINENIQFVGLHNNIKIESLDTYCKINNLTLKRCNATLLNIKADDVKLEEGLFICSIGFNSLRLVSSDVTLFGGLLNTTSPINLYGSTLKGIANLNVVVNDWGCHGVYSFDTNMTIGDTFTSSLVEKAKVIFFNLKLDTKLYTCSINGNGIRELNVTNIFNNSDGYIMASFHITRNGNTLSFDDVREINNTGVAKTTNTPNDNYKINGITLIL